MDSIADKINRDFIAAYKDRDEQLVSVLRMIKSAIQNTEIALKAKLSEAETIKLLKKEIKQRKEASQQYIQGGREDLAKKEDGEVAILEKYLPAEMSNEEIEAVVVTVIDELKASSKADFGKVMSAAMARLGGLADGANVSKIVNSKL